MVLELVELNIESPVVSFVTVKSNSAPTSPNIVICLVSPKLETLLSPNVTLVISFVVFSVGLAIALYIM